MKFVADVTYSCTIYDCWGDLETHPDGDGFVCGVCRAGYFPEGFDLVHRPEPALTGPVRFEPAGTDWAAARAAETFIRERGWSIGPSDVSGYRGVLFQPGVRIAKWKNLTPDERAECDAVLEGRGRETGRVLRPTPAVVVTG